MTYRAWIRSSYMAEPQDMLAHIRAAEDALPACRAPFLATEAVSNHPFKATASNGLICAAGAIVSAMINATVPSIRCVALRVRRTVAVGMRPDRGVRDACRQHRIVMHQATVEQQPFEMTHRRRHRFDRLRKRLETLRDHAVNEPGTQQG